MSDALRKRLLEGFVIPACPLALNGDGFWSEKHQRALVRYYLESGAGGLAVGVHTTQFAIRDPKHGLYEPVLEFCANTVESESEEGSIVKVAGICGETEQAVAEAETAMRLGYDTGLLALGATKGWPEEKVVEHCRQVAEVIPVFGFYLHEGVGGRELSYRFWRDFCEIENVVAIKIAAFNRYQTLDVIRAVIASGRDDIALYTGNDDHIIGDLLTGFSFEENEHAVTRWFAGGLLGQWAVWTSKAVKMLEEIKVERGAGGDDSFWLNRNVHLTDVNAVLFDAANGFAGCIPGINEVLRRQGLVPSNRCLDPGEVLSPGQAEEIDRISRAYPWLVDDDFVAENLDRWLS